MPERPSKRKWSGKPSFGPRRERVGGKAQPWKRDRPGAGSDTAILYGWHTVTAALANPHRKFRKLLVTENTLRRLTQENIALPVAPEMVRPDAIAARLSPDAVHQGLFAETEPLDGPALEDVSAEGVVLVLDQITDPHNVGAILRSAAAFDVTAVVVPARYSPEATGVLAKAASGALDVVPMVMVGNLVRAITALKERGFGAVGLDSDADGDLAGVETPSPLVLVLGAEGKGLRQSTRAACDRIARLDMPGKIKTLNVSNAAALALYIVTRRPA
jgi:23S rRNA (guanosine2251-2'-O)-methyltransferase